MEGSSNCVRWSSVRVLLLVMVGATLVLWTKSTGTSTARTSSSITRFTNAFSFELHRRSTQRICRAADRHRKIQRLCTYPTVSFSTAYSDVPVSNNNSGRVESNNVNGKSKSADDDKNNSNDCRDDDDDDDNSSNDEKNRRSSLSSPWNDPNLVERSKNKKFFRSRQHVNPLARRFQEPTVLSKNWPNDVFDNLSKPIFLDIGCARGGFLVEIASNRPDDYNYLGLEIRPSTAYYAKRRIAKHDLQGRLDFVGCNANVDLERLLTLLTAAERRDDSTSTRRRRRNLRMVTIQFPDPHFKARHSKRRVVTPELVQTLADFMPTGATVFLQSDIQSVLDEMRLQFREFPEHFQDKYESVHDYVADNVLDMPTEREKSVLERDLPVYRAIFTRT